MKRTVFVLGAGAGVVFGFPVGDALCRTVCESMHSGSKSSYAKEFRECCNFNDEEINNFCNQLQMSGQSSVDAFVEYRTEFLELGKAAIAFILVRYEDPAHLWRSFDQNWLRYLFGRMNAPFEKFHETPISFITFNYDRSVEHFLHTSLQHTYGKATRECAAILDRIPIIHLHGRLGYLPWQEGEGRRPYDTVMNRDVMDICIKNIKVVHEDITDGRDKDFERAHKLLQEAEFIYYLGFGYGSKNMERLNIRALQPTVTYGSGHGLTSKECSDIVKLAEDGTQRINPLSGADCIQILRNYVDWS